ncbi:hypothetical protein OIU77_013231 [Salix suchowensis]|uniref:DEAD/DEAH box helicase domain-containing protein n=1 Tax=Salix suchowensis TaxID=1278906 RepID=A0ABQ8ZTE5_9ROSI|nr:hypothetical protein OIU77_013231 [Salix suchowensis]
MAKGDDALAKKKNKDRRKKMRKEGSSVSARVASIIAAKKRRISGRRSMCQGMCFSLPSPDDPFNDRNGKLEFQTKKSKKKPLARKNEKAFVKGKMKGTENEKAMSVGSENKKSLISNNNSGTGQEKAEVQMNGKVGRGRQRQARENVDCPSKFLMYSLNEIEKALRHEGNEEEEDESLFVSPWGVEFLKCYSTGKDILESSGTSCTTEQIAWIVSMAADIIVRREEEDLSVPTPSFLFLVPSQEEAAKVRLVCKPLKALGIHAVSIHPGSSIDHQIQGLASCEPEFLVSTPDRLLELVSLKAIDISGVSFMAVDGVESLYNGGCLNALKSIRQSISGNLRTVVFNNFLSGACVPVLQNLLLGSICRLSIDQSIPSQSACIVQTIHLCTSEEERLLKSIQVLDHACDSLLCSQPLKVLYVVGNDNNSFNLVKMLEINGYTVSVESNRNISDDDDSLDTNTKMKPVVSVINLEHISSTNLAFYETVILPNFVPSIDNYVQVLTRMARHSINGNLHSFLTKEDAPIARSLTGILEQCGQAVPRDLKKLASHIIRP